MHKSIFLKANDYVGDPIIEYNKITKLLSRNLYYHYSFYTMMNNNFKICKSLRNRFIDLDDCLSKSVPFLITYKSNGNLINVPECHRNDVFDNFLTFSEIIFTMFLTLVEYDKTNHIYNDHHFDKDLFQQGVDMINFSLKSLNYKINIINPEDFNVEAIKIDEIAEMVAAQSEPTIKSDILHYLGARDNDIKEKENRLHQLIDLLEPSFDKYKNDNTVKDIKEYIQMVRHPEIYKAKKEYDWFFKDKKEYLDKLFSLCVYIQQFVISKETLKEFKQLKKDCFWEN